MIELKNLSVGYPGRRVLDGVDLTIRPGEVLALIGPNGCGKSTLLRTAAGLQPPLGGEVLVNGVPAGELTRRQMAQKVAWLSQSRNVPSITARRMVLHGRFPYLSYPRRYRAEDRAAAEEALAAADVADLGSRNVQELSGGQRQRVYLAMALAQDTQNIFLDEPTTYLDIGHQLELMSLLRRLTGEGKAVAVILHDLPLALRTADRVALLHDGRVQLIGTPEEIWRSGLPDRVFGVKLRRAQTENGWYYYCE